VPFLFHWGYLSYEPVTCHVVVKCAPFNRGTADYGVIARDLDVVIGQANLSQELCLREVTE
jgi:hypothetical protein